MSSSSSHTTPPPTHSNGSTNSSQSPIDTLFLQNLMNRMQLRPPFLDTNSYLTSSLDDFLLSDLAFLSAAASDSDSDDNISDISSLADDLADADEDISDSNKEARRRRMMAKEEAKLEKEIVRLVHSGNATSALRPNSGQSVAVGDHHVCVGFHEDSNGEYRVWEWHGHVMLFDDDEGYSAEYIYGNYFERLSGGGGRNAFVGKKNEVNKRKSRRGEVEEEEEMEKEKDVSLGLRDLIIGDGSGSDAASSSVPNGGGRVVHRNHAINAGPASAASAAR